MTMKRSLLRQGFTLIELIVVVIILGVLASVTIASGIEMRRRDQINSVTTSLSGWIEQVRRSAQRGVGCAVTIGGTNLRGGEEYASSRSMASSNTSISDTNVCMVNDPLVIPGSFAGNRGFFSISSASLTLTPRGTAILSSDPTSIVISQSGSTTSRCIRLSGMLGIQEIKKGSSCGAEERF